MIEYRRCPTGQLRAHVTDVVPAQSPTGSSKPVFLFTMRENRSAMPAEGRAAAGAVVALFVAMSILPALAGNLLVPCFTVAAMAALVGAIEYHLRSKPRVEWLEIGPQGLSYRSSAGQGVNFPTLPTRLVLLGRSSLECRLVLRSTAQSLEIGRCLSLAERREVAALIEDALRQTQRGFV